MIHFELESLLTRPEQEPILMDMIHAVCKYIYIYIHKYFSKILKIYIFYYTQAAYRSNTLGFPKICPKENIDLIDRKILFDYLKRHYLPHRMVVAGVGIEHEDLVSAVQK